MAATPKKWQCPYCLQPVGILGNWFAVLFGTRFHGCDFDNDDATLPDWQEITRSTTLVVEDVFRNEVKWSGSIQGTLGTWFKDSNSFHLKDFVRGNNVRCVYHPSRYKEVHALFENRDEVVHVEGEIKSDVASGRAREIKLTKLITYPALTDADFDKLLEGSKNLTDRSD